MENPRGQIIFKLTRLLRRSFDAEFKRNFGEKITISESWILSHLNENEGVTFSNVVDSFKMTKSTASECISSLKEKGFIEIHKNPKDKREKLIYLTEKGRNVALETKKLLDENDARLFAEVTEEEYAALNSVYEKLLKQEEVK